MKRHLKAKILSLLEARKTLYFSCELLKVHPTTVIRWRRADAEFDKAVRRLSEYEKAKAFKAHFESLKGTFKEDPGEEGVETEDTGIYETGARAL